VGTFISKSDHRDKRHVSPGVNAIVAAIQVALLPLLAFCLSNGGFALTLATADPTIHHP